LGEVGEEDDGFGFWIGLVGQDRVVAGGMVAEDQFSGGRSLDPEELGSDGHTAIRADFDRSAHTPDEGPSGTAWNQAGGGAIFLLSQPPGLLGFHRQRSVDLVWVAKETKSLDMGVGLVNVGDPFAGEGRGQAFLPEEVAAERISRPKSNR